MIIMRGGRDLHLNITATQLNLIETRDPMWFNEVYDLSESEIEQHVREMVKFNRDRTYRAPKSGSMTVYGPFDPNLYEELFVKPLGALTQVLRWGWTHL